MNHTRHRCAAALLPALFGAGCGSAPSTPPAASAKFANPATGAGAPASTSPIRRPPSTQEPAAAAGLTLAAVRARILEANNLTVAAEALRRGVSVLTARPFAVSPPEPQALRLTISAPIDDASLDRAFEVLFEIIGGERASDAASLRLL